MSNSSENYLDRLLNSVGKKARQEEADAAVKADVSAELDELISDSQPTGEKKKKSGARKNLKLDHDFESDLEYELGLDSDLDSDLLDQFELLDSSLGEFADQDADASEKDEESLLEDIAVPVGREPIEYEDFDLFEKLDESILSARADSKSDISEREAGEERESGETGESVEAEEPDLAGNGELNLLDLLSEEGEMSDIGDLLSMSESGVSVESGDSIGEFAKQEMEAQSGSPVSASEKSEEAPGENATKKGLFSGLKSVFAKLFSRGKASGDSGDDSVTVNTDFEGTGIGVEALSEENLQILRELEAADRADTESKQPGVKAKKEKKGKSKKAKAKKEKNKQAKAKKTKEKKPKRPRPEKEVDNTPPIPKKPMILIFALVGTIVVAMLILTNLTGYENTIKSAGALYAAGAAKTSSYVDAYETIAGTKVKEKDIPLSRKIEIMASVAGQYERYEIFSTDTAGTTDVRLNALDSLVCAAGRCDLNKPAAAENGCEAELEALRIKIQDVLGAQYQLSFEDATALYGIRDRGSYTVELRRILER